MAKQFQFGTVVFPYSFQSMEINPNKGRRARRPSQIPFKGYKEIFKRVVSQINNDHVQIVSAGIAFYCFMAVFPTIAAAFFIYGLIMDPVEIQAQLSKLISILPNEAGEMIAGIMETSAEKSDKSLGWGLLISIALSIWSANKGMSAIFQGINIAYDETDDRNIFKKYGLTLLFTFGGIIIGLICVGLVIGFSAFVDALPLPEVMKTIISYLRWPLMGIIIALSLSIIYKIAPDRTNPKFKWVIWGALIATVIWIGGSLIFSLYVNNFGSYDKTYGSFGAVIILMLWFFLSAFIILLGAEIASEMEHQTEIDTTIGPEQPMGDRGAYHADHIPDQSKY